MKKLRVITDAVMHYLQKDSGYTDLGQIGSQLDL